MKRFYKEIYDFIFYSIYSDTVCFIVSFVPYLIIGSILAIAVSELIEVTPKSYSQVKYEFVTQDGEVKEGRSCKTDYGEGICTGYDGTKYFNVKSYKLIEESGESND